MHHGAAIPSAWGCVWTLQSIQQLLQRITLPDTSQNRSTAGAWALRQLNLTKKEPCTAPTPNLLPNPAGTAAPSSCSRGPPTHSQLFSTGFAAVQGSTGLQQPRISRGHPAPELRPHLGDALNAVGEQDARDQPHAHGPLGAHSRAAQGGRGEAGHLAHKLALGAHGHQELAGPLGQGARELLGLAGTLRTAAAMTGRQGLGRGCITRDRQCVSGRWPAIAVWGAQLGVCSQACGSAYACLWVMPELCVCRHVGEERRITRLRDWTAPQVPALPNEVDVRVRQTSGRRSVTTTNALLMWAPWICCTPSQSYVRERPAT